MTHEEMATTLRNAGYRVENPGPKYSPEEARRANVVVSDKGHERMPGTDPRTGEYSTAQMLYDECYGGDTSQPLFD